MGMGGFGRSRAQRYEPKDGRRVTFDDVAGIDDVEEEVAEIVDLLRHPERYRRLGATPPKGVLLSGPPPSWPGPSPARPTCPSTRRRPRSSSR